MSDYRNDNRNRDAEKNGTLWRPAYNGNRPRRRYVIKRPVYRQPIVWILIALAVCIVILCGSLMNWGRGNNTDLTLDPNAPGGVATGSPSISSTDQPGMLPSETPAPTPTPVPTPVPSPTPNEGPLVWDTPGGTGFHFDENCKGMQNATQESMMSAYNSGKQPCERCVTSSDAIAARPAITVKALTGLPAALGNVVIQDPQVFDVYDITYQLGSLSGQPALMVNGKTTGSISLLYTNQPDVYDVRVRAFITNAAGSVIWDIDGEPVAYAQAGLDMPRDISLVTNISTTDIGGCTLTVLVYAKDGFANADADIAVLGMYQTALKQP